MKKKNLENHGGWNGEHPAWVDRFSDKKEWQHFPLGLAWDRTFTCSFKKWICCIHTAGQTWIKALPFIPVKELKTFMCG